MSTVVELVKRNFELQNELETAKKENEQLKKGMSAMLTKNNETINYLNKELGSTKRLLSEIVEMNAELKKENARLREALVSILELDILGNDNQGKMAMMARKVLKRGE